MITSTYGKVKLGDVVTLMHQGINTAADKVEYVDSGVPIIQSKHFTSGTLSLDDSKCLGKNDVLKYGEKYTPKLGDILFSNIGTVGKSVVLEETPEFMFAWNVFLIRLNSEKAHNRYIKHFFDYLLSLNVYERWFTGGTVKFLNKKTMAEIEIPLPPLEEQKRIAAVLDKADSVRRKRQQAIDLADDFLRSVFLDMFGDPVTNPKGWDVKKFGTVIDVLTDYHANGSYKTLNENVTLLDEPNYAYMVRTTDLEKKNYTDNVKYIDQDAYEHLSKTKVYGGELVINKIGSAGAVYLMPYLNRPVSLAMNQFMIRCNEHCLNEFVYYQLKTNAGARELEKRVQGAVTKTITKDAVRDIPVILPPIKLQRQFIDVVEKINKLKTNTENSSDLIGAKFNSISQKAFAGEL